MTRGRAQAAVTVAALLWGTSGVITDVLLDAGFGSVELGFWRLLVGGTLFAMQAQRTGGLRLQHTSDAIPLLLLGVLVVAGNYAAFGLGLQHGGMSLINLFIAVAPGLIATGAYVWFREAVGTRTVVLVAIGVMGLSLAALGGSSGVTVTPASLGFGVLTTVTIVAYTLGSKALLDRHSPVTVSAISMLVGAAALVPFVRFENRPLGAWIGVAVLGVGATYLAHLLYLRGLEVLGATVTGLLVSMETPVALAVAAVLLGERFTSLGLAGVALVVLSSVAVMAPARVRRPAREVAAVLPTQTTRPPHEAALASR